LFKEFHHQVRGRGHAADGTPCQDRTQYLSRHGVKATCLADGAGSASHSGYGAQVVTDVGCGYLVDHFDSLIRSDDASAAKGAVVDHLVGALAKAAERLSCQVADLASTFLAVAVSGDRFVGMHIGDGVIGYLKNGELHVASAPDNAEYANQTTFVTSSGAASRMRLFRGSLHGVTGFVLMSDGTSSSLYDVREAKLAPACIKLIETVGGAPTLQVRAPAHKKQLRRVLETQIRAMTKDDCSLAILARPQAV
jgi:serine/threonine protein phosphatase PrpC